MGYNYWNGTEAAHRRVMMKAAGYSDEDIRQKPHIGIQIDSLSDIVCFGVAPAVLCYCFGMRGVIGVAILMFYVLAGLIRLAWFNVMEEQRQEETAEK